MWFYAPWVHSESIAVHRQVQIWYNELRVDIEKETGTTDPYREGKDELMRDVFGFPRMYRAGPPKGKDGGLSKEDYVYWFLALMDVHFPIVERYGRYPYRNRGAGRESREEEKEWIVKAEGFGECDEETGRKIVEDVRKGVWTPLGEGVEGKA
ncbi:hypothetical protein EG329_001969 [Mollisiaceae sp. DMI_Dod_QoI]|nr:hypothetical protein EG329_001969 [Helotiales sp. DMI_Dod_QoI]